MLRVETAVIPVAGLGTRFLPVSKGVAKELLPVIDKPVIQYIVEELVASGIRRIIFVVSDNKREVLEYFQKDEALEVYLTAKGKMNELASIQHLHDMAEFFAVEQHQPLGFGHAVLQARDVVGNTPFIVCGGDDIIDGDVPAARELVEVYERNGGASVIGVVRVPAHTVNRYGIVAPLHDGSDRTFQIKDVIEKPSVESAPSNCAAGGRWLVTPEIFESLARIEPGAGGEIQLTDALKDLLQTQPMYAHQYSGVYRDCGNKVEYIKAIIAFGRRHPVLGAEIEQFIHSA
ncbi:MAG: UTP--glucose-1-phosphate uridylyltransferase [Candidatus Kerfeldbacteria bacterium]|nr:UTP--glucose-1-phosphate uridylyltransferase [Candidatus Kerfeldbacteria bacterium]